MATFDKTGQGGTTGHPANGRTPYLVENTIDFSVSGFQPAAMISCKHLISLQKVL